MSINIKLPWFLCAALAMCAIWLLFKLIDQSVTLDHQAQYAKVIVQQRDVLIRMLNATAIGESESGVRTLLRQFAGDSMFDKGKDEVVAAQVSFVFREGRLASVGEARVGRESAAHPDGRAQ